MSNNKQQKIRILKLYDILRSETNESVMLSTNQLMEKLDKLGYQVTRKTLYDDISALNDNGYEVLCRKSNTNLYYIMDREFDKAEIKILMDAVQSANFLTEGRTAQIIDKLSHMNGNARGGALLENCITFGENKTLDSRVYYSIDVINTALVDKKKISFRYTDFDENGKRCLRKNGKLYTANPVKLVNDDSRYYLVTYNTKHDTLTNYRVDRMADVAVDNQDIDICLDMINKSKERKRKMFSMFNGQEVRCTIEIEKYIIGAMVDKFGEGLKFLPCGNNRLQFSTSVFDSSAFISWCVKYGSNIKVISPQSVVDKIKAVVLDLQNNYM